MKNCPNCKSSWIGELIPEELNKPYEYQGEICYPYGKSAHWERQICIDGGYLGIYDGTVALRCPDCKIEVPVNNSSWAKELYGKYIKATACEIPEYAFKCDNCTCEDE